MSRFSYILLFKYSVVSQHYLNVFKRVFRQVTVTILQIYIDDYKLKLVHIYKAYQEIMF